MSDWPAPMFSTPDEYRAAAMLVGMKYDAGDHTFMPDESGASFYNTCLCPETMKPAYVLPDLPPTEASSVLATFGGLYTRRKEAVQQGKLGPGAHSRDR